MKTEQISVEYIDHMGTDLSAVDAARVSFGKESCWQDANSQTLQDKDAKLIGYLAAHDHWSPFAHTQVSLRVKAPIFLARQLVKHTVGCAWNEVSRRYVDDTPEFWLPEVLHVRPANLKQGAGLQSASSPMCRDAMQSHSDNALELYQSLLEEGIAPEEARMVLPLNTMTEWVWSGSVVYWARVYRLRADSHAQLAAQEVAHAIAAVVQPLFPASWAALTGAGK